MLFSRCILLFAVMVLYVQKKYFVGFPCIHEITLKEETNKQTNFVGILIYGS